MPPKGWRKNAEGKFPQNPKDLELVSIDEILFPKSTISKLAKIITTSDNDSSMIVSKDSLLALQRSATVFVSHLMFHARQVAKDADRKNVSAQDILQGLERADLSGFIPEVKQKLASYESSVEIKKKQKAEQKLEKAEDAADGPAAKKLKDNDQQLVIPENADDEEQTEETDDEVDEKEDLEDVQDDDGDDGTPAANPIALLGQEEEELEGDKEDTVGVEESSDED